jgi:LysR family glycine cleavage system transcriptional activator
MQGRFHRTQHLLNALPVLEASARLGSFTKAGEHLGLSQPTVSRHISNLEDHLGAALFVRNHNKLTVTKQGRELANAADLGLSHIDAAVRKIAMEAAPDGIRLACTQSFANCWLLPRFSQLRHAVDGQQIHLLPSYWLDDIDLEGVDVIVHWRPQGWAGWPSTRLFDEITFPVCAPEYLARNPSLDKCVNDPSLLSQFQLLHYEERATEFVSWADWFANFDCTYQIQKGAYRFSNYQFMLQAAVDCEAVALGWHHLVADRIVAGELVQVGPAFRRPNAGYFLEYRAGGGTSKLQRQILDWFKLSSASTMSIFEE